MSHARQKGNQMIRAGHESKKPPSAGSIVASLVLACCLLAVIPASALALRGHAFGFAFGGEGSGNGQFKEPSAIAVNEASGDVYVLDRGNDRVEYFTSSGAYLGQFNGEGSPPGEFSNPDAIAVDNACVQQKLSEPACKEADPSNGDVYVADRNRHVYKFSAAGAYLGPIEVPHTGPRLELDGVAVDTHGDVWISDDQTELKGFDKFDNKLANEFVSFQQPSSGGFLLEPGLAVDGEEDLYPVVIFGKVSNIAVFSANGKTLKEDFDEEATSNNEAANGVATESPSNDVYVDNVGSIRRYTPSDSLVERFGVGHLPSTCQGFPVECEKPNRGGVAVDSASGTLYVVVGPTDEVQVYPPEPPGPPSVAGVSVVSVTAGSATFQAEVNPRGASTEYRFEYGRCSSLAACASSGYEESTPVPDGLAGSDFELDGVSAHPQDLVADSVYHFRVVAHSALGTAESQEGVFVTQPVGVLGLLDGRGYELVSPPQKHGALIGAISETTVIEAASLGNAIAYVAFSPTETEPSGESNGVQVLSSRSSSGWSSQDITTPHLSATGASVGFGGEYRFSSEDLSKSVLQPFGAFEPSLSPEASEQTAFLHSNYLGGDPSAFCTTGCLRPLVTAANTGEGVRFGEEGKCPPRLVCGPLFISATGDLNHIVLDSNIGLTTKEGDQGGLYEWSGGSLQLVSVLPDGNPATPANHQALGWDNNVVRHAISTDGDRVVWSTIHGHLYLRKVAEEQTIELDAGLSGEPQFQTANAQTTKIFFSEESGLYLYDTETSELTTLVPAKGGVQGIVAGASEDGSYLYFVANRKLSEGAVEGNCHEDASTAAESCNLYELHEEGGGWQVRLVAVLSGEDSPDFAGNGLGGLKGLTARVSPDGNYLAFMSQRPLTGYDNRDAASGKRDEEVFLFNAGTGTLVCASCKPTGARPEGVEYEKIAHGLVSGDRVWNPTSWLAANIPGWTPYTSFTALHQSRYLSDSGRLFFNSADVLSPQDVNGTQDVYEYEPPGTGNCSAESPSFSERSGGCVGLISSGGSAEESGFLDASETGSDVFFLTQAKLVSQDYDTALDVYDAHECTTSSPCLLAREALPPACTTEASCRAAPSPQPAIFGSPASATFAGIGNVAPPRSETVTPRSLTRAQKLARALGSCRKRYQRAKGRRVACERQAKRRFGKQASTGKATKRGRG